MITVTIKIIDISKKDIENRNKIFFIHYVIQNLLQMTRIFLINASRLIIKCEQFGYW